MSQKIILFFIILFLTACGSVQPLYEGRPQFADLHPTIAEQKLFRAAPPVRVKQLQYVALAYPSNDIYSDYTIYPEQSRGRLTEYITRERPPIGALKATPVVNGEGVGYGGIFMLLYRKRGSVLTQPHFYQKYAMTNISNVRGHLFPLQVGNELDFHYQAVHTSQQALGQEYGQADGGSMEYKVVQQLPCYDFHQLHLAGPIYKIEVWRTTRANPLLHLQYAYYFSPRLGWYIWAQYFANNKLIANYRLVRYQTSCPVCLH